ncbi:MAG: FxsA family protein [SAR324 cluster bacterium]|nr:FxsA family protein [SAR324 cluster bacterium]MEC8435048.1 FxsA family protein [SAR324 cluster bacterium]
MSGMHWSLLGLLILIEGLLLILLGRESGLLGTILLSSVTAVGGLWLMREEDFSIWTLVEVELQQRRLPTDELWQAFLLWLAGVLLLVPGVLTDALGLSLTVPDIRSALIDQLNRYFRQRWNAAHGN